MTDFHSDTETDFSDGETIYSDSDMSTDESVHTSDEDFIDDSDVSEDDSTEDDSEDEYVPEYKRQKLVSCEDEQKVEIKFINGQWVLNVINVPISSNQ